MIDNYADRFPSCHIKVTSESSVSLLESLKRNRLDMAVMALWKKLSLKNFLVHYLGREEVVLFSAPDHHLQQQTLTSLRQLQGEKFIMRDERSATRKYIIGEFKKQGISLPVSIECESPDLVKELIMEGKGIGFLTRTKISNELAAGKVKEVGLGKNRFYLNIALVWNKNRHLTPELQSLIDCIIQAGKDNRLLPAASLRSGLTGKTPATRTSGTAAGGMKTIPPVCGNS
jgi:DNA-binding transcriptional LysR family regulator